MLQAVAGGGGGGGSGLTGGRGHGGGSGGDEGSFGGDGAEPTAHGSTPFRWQGWEDRVAADPQFLYKVFIEQIIGVGAAVVGDMSSRPFWGLYELDFVFSTLVVGSIVNFSLMYLLAPTAGGAAAAHGPLARLFSEQTLKAWGAPGGHMFEAGYPAAKRMLNFLYKGLLFGLVGMAAGTIGTGTSNGLLALRKRLDARFEAQNAPPSVLLNAGTWAAHMGVSSNLRYQLINGLDMMLQPRLPPAAFKVLTSLLRTANNIVGGMSFVTLAKLFGVQASAGDEKRIAGKEPLLAGEVDLRGKKAC